MLHRTSLAHISVDVAHLHHQREPKELTLQFTAFEHGTFHWSMALVFIAFTALCAIFQSAEIVRLPPPRFIAKKVGRVADKQWSLHKDHPDRRHLLRNSVVKLVVITFAVAGAISFGVTYGIVSGPHPSNYCILQDYTDLTVRRRTTSDQWPHL